MISDSQKNKWANDASLKTEFMNIDRKINPKTIELYINRLIADGLFTGVRAPSVFHDKAQKDVLEFLMSQHGKCKTSVVRATTLSLKLSYEEKLRL